MRSARAAVLVAAALAVAPLALTGPDAHAADGTDPVAVVAITTVDQSTVARDDGLLSLHGTVATSVAVQHLHVQLAAHGVTDRGQLAALRSDETGSGFSVALDAAPDGEDVGQGRRSGPGHPAPFDVQVRGSDVTRQLGDAAPAVDLTVTVTGDGPKGVTVTGTAHLRMPVTPSYTPAAPPYVSFVIPVTDPPAEGVGQEGTGADLASIVAPEGRIATLLGGVSDALAAGVGEPQVTLAVDPALVERFCAAAGCSQHAAAAGVPAEVATNARTLLQELTTLARTPGVTLSALPYGDADLDALTSAGQADVLTSRLLGPAGALLGEDLGVGTVGLSPAVPAGGTLSEGALALLRQQEIRTVVVDHDALPPRDETAYTASAVGTVNTRNGAVTALVTDPTLQTLLARADQGAVSAAGPVEDLLAEEATLAAERPNDTEGQRAVALLAPRSWAPSRAYVAALVEGLAQSGWARTTQPGDASTLPSVARVDKLGAPSNTLGHSLIDTIGMLRSRTDLAEQMFTDAVATTVGTPLERALDRASSSWWRTGDAPATKLTAAVKAQTDHLLGGVGLSHADSVLLTGSHGKLPIQLINTLPYPVRLRVELTPVAGSRVQQTWVNFTVPASAGREVRQQESLPVTSRSAGKFPVNLQLETWQGGSIGASQEVRVRSSNYGKFALVLTGSALAVLILALLVRAVRAIRRARRGGARRARAQQA